MELGVYTFADVMPHRDILHAIELLGTRVAPVVRRDTGQNED